MVTLHTEGVDRNSSFCFLLLLQKLVTLHTEGVDRNTEEAAPAEGAALSPSTRRVWIEIVPGSTAPR